MGQSSSVPATTTGVNDIPPPQFDANANAPPQKQHNRVIDFVRVSQVRIRCTGETRIAWGRSRTTTTEEEL
jgi:hypothetical protein